MIPDLLRDSRRRVKTKRGQRRKKSLARLGRRLRVEALEERTLLATFAWAVGADGFWNEPANWAVNGAPNTDEQLPGDDDDVVISLFGVDVKVTYPSQFVTINNLTNSERLEILGGVLTIDNTLTLSGGTLAGAGDVDVANLIWNGGTMSGSGTTTVRTGGTLQVVGGTLDERTLDNKGAGIWTGKGNIRAINGAVFDNYGTLDLKSDAFYSHFDLTGATPKFNN